MKLGSPQKALAAGGVTIASGPTVSPAYIGVGYIIGPELAAMNFAGGVLAWGLMVPLLIFFLGPRLHDFLPGVSTDESWLGLANCDLALHRAPHRSGRNDGGCRVHFIQNAERSVRRAFARRFPI